MISQEEQDKKRKEQIAINKAFYITKKREIESNYMEEYIAIVDGEIHHSKDFIELREKLMERLRTENKYAYVTKVGKPPENTLDDLSFYHHFFIRGKI